MLAPEPFFEPRGTPFSEYHRIRALAELGHTVDLVTYPFGKDVALPGLRVFRSLRPPFIKHVAIGPSLAKIPLDILLTVTTIRRVFSDRYDAVHSHEESSLVGVLLASALGVPHVYDMHSSLPQQLTNFAFSNSRILARLFAWAERFVLRRSRVVIVICPHLEETVRAIEPQVPTVLIENSPGSFDMPAAGSGRRVREALGLRAETPVVLYTGTFEPYQGLNLLFAAAAYVARQRPEVRFVLVGGRADQVEDARLQARAAGAPDTIVCAGQRPAEERASFLDAADLLVSPRSAGTNTPLKIYQYLRSSRPIVATRLLTHTQVLNDEVAYLADATPAGFGDAILAALGDPDRARLVAQRARQLADTKYSYEVYLNRTRQACAYLTGEGTPEVAGGVA